MCYTINILIVAKGVSYHNSHKKTKTRLTRTSTMSSPSTSSYKLPFDLFHPDLSNERTRAKYMIRYQAYYQLKAFFAVSETKTNTKNALADLMEENFNNAVNKCPHLADHAMKQALKLDFRGQGEKAFERAKAHKKQAIAWNAIMKPHETLPSGTTEKASFLINKLLDVLWKEHKEKNKKKFQRAERDAFFEPSKLWSTYVHLELWDHPKCKAPGSLKSTSAGVDGNDSEEDEQKLRESAMSRKQQRKEEQNANKARKKANNAETYALKGSLNDAKVIQAQASAQYVKMKSREQKVVTATSVLGLNEDTLKHFSTPVRKKLFDAAAHSLLGAMADTPPDNQSEKKPAATSRKTASTEETPVKDLTKSSDFVRTPEQEVIVENRKESETRTGSESPEEVPTQLVDTQQTYDDSDDASSNLLQHAPYGPPLKTSFTATLTNTSSDEEDLFVGLGRSAPLLTPTEEEKAMRRAARAAAKEAAKKAHEAKKKLEL